MARIRLLTGRFLVRALAEELFPSNIRPNSLIFCFWVQGGLKLGYYKVWKLPPGNLEIMLVEDESYDRSNKFIGSNTELVIRF